MSRCCVIIGLKSQKSLPNSNSFLGARPEALGVEKYDRFILFFIKVLLFFLGFLHSLPYLVLLFVLGEFIYFLSRTAALELVLFFSHVSFIHEYIYANIIRANIIRKKTILSVVSQRKDGKGSWKEFRGSKKWACLSDLSFQWLKWVDRALLQTWCSEF